MSWLYQPLSVTCPDYSESFQLTESQEEEQAGHADCDGSLAHVIFNIAAGIKQSSHYHFLSQFQQN